MKDILIQDRDEKVISPSHLSVFLFRSFFFLFFPPSPTLLDLELGHGSVHPAVHSEGRPRKMEYNDTVGQLGARMAKEAIGLAKYIKILGRAYRFSMRMLGICMEMSSKGSGFSIQGLEICAWKACI